MRVLGVTLAVLLLLTLPAHSATSPLRGLRGHDDDDAGETDAFGPVRRDDDGRIRGDLGPFDCGGKYQDQGWVYGPDDYGCKGGSGQVKIANGATVVRAGRSERYDGTMESCQSYVRANIAGELDSPRLNCFRCFVTVNKRGDCFLYSRCGKLGYSEEDLTSLYCGLT